MGCHFSNFSIQVTCQFLSRLTVKAVDIAEVCQEKRSLKTKRKKKKDTKKKDVTNKTSHFWAPRRIHGPRVCMHHEFCVHRNVIYCVCITNDMCMQCDHTGSGYGYRQHGPANFDYDHLLVVLQDRHAPETNRSDTILTTRINPSENSTQTSTCCSGDAGPLPIWLTCPITPIGCKNSGTAVGFVAKTASGDQWLVKLGMVETSGKSTQSILSKSVMTRGVATNAIKELLATKIFRVRMFICMYICMCMRQSVPNP